MRVIAFVSPLGGVGRTAATMLIAAGLVAARRGRRVLVLDATGAAAADGLAGWARRLRPGLRVAGELLAAQSTPDVSSVLAALDRARGGGSHACGLPPHVVLLDTAGRLGGGGPGQDGAVGLTQLALHAAHLALLPVHGALDAERTAWLLGRRALLPPGLPTRALLCGFGGPDTDPDGDPRGNTGQPDAAARRRAGRAALIASGLTPLDEALPHDPDLLADLWQGHLPTSPQARASWDAILRLAQDVARLADDGAGDRDGDRDGGDDDRRRAPLRR